MCIVRANLCLVIVSISTYFVGTISIPIVGFVGTSAYFKKKKWIRLRTSAYFKKKKMDLV